MRRFCEAFAYPERHFRSILVAGTNGKGSVTRMLSSALSAQGYCVGQYTSPHLIHYSERIVLNNKAIQNKDISHYLYQINQVENKLDEKLSFFEITTLMAFLFFRDKKADIAVLEVGLGGRLDATNVVDPILSIITSIGYDHQDILGDTLTLIAREKCGIMRPHKPIVIGYVPEDAFLEIKRLAEERQSQFISLQADVQITHDKQESRLIYAQQSYTHVKPKLQGPHQRNNASLCALALLILNLHCDIICEKPAFFKGLLAHWPGRYQKLQWRPSVQVIIDGAHNPDGINALKETLQQDADFTCTSERILIFGSTNGRDNRTVFNSLVELFDRVLLVAPISTKAVDSSIYQTLYPSAHIKPNVSSAMSDVPTCACVVITGSLYLAGDALAFFSNTTRDHVFDYRPV